MKRRRSGTLFKRALYKRNSTFIFGNLENNEDRINEVINVTKGLLEAWREVHNNETVAQ